MVSRVNSDGDYQRRGGSLYSSLSIAQTAKAIDGQFLPLTFNLDNSYGPIQIYLDVPFVAAMGVNALSLRLPVALASILSVILVYVLAQQLFANRLISLASMAVTAVSPWFIHMNHGAYDGLITMLFLVSLVSFIRGVRQGNILPSLIWIALSFYTYHSSKILWVTYIPFLLFVFSGELLQRQKWKTAVFIFSCILLVGSFVSIMNGQHVTRQKVLDIPDMSALSAEVNSLRRTSIAPSYLNTIFLNKATVYASRVFERYVQAFSPQFLFTSGEGGIYGSWHHGVLYLADAVLLAFGVWHLFRTVRKRTVVFVLGSIALAPLPSTFTTDVSYALRGIHMAPFLHLVIGLGWYQAWCMLWKNRDSLRLVLFGFLLLVYLYSIAAYCYLYFFRYSVFGAEYWFKSSKDVAVLAGLQEEKFDHVIIGMAGKMFMFQYGVYNNIPLEPIVKAWNGKPPYTIGNVSILDDCLDTQKPFNPKTSLLPSTLYITRSSCHPEATPAATIQDWGEPLRNLWSIYIH